MHSVATRGITILTIITLIYVAVIGANHKTHRKLISRTVVTQKIKCKAHAACPKTRTRTIIIVRKAPTVGRG